MQLFDLFEGRQTEDTFIDALRDFLPLAIDYLEIKQLPKIDLVKEIDSNGQPTFGQLNPNTNQVTLAINHRHPVDILRTLAHELVHVAQNERGELDDGSGDTGSDIENEANAEAGVILRMFSKKYPQYLNLIPLDLP